MSAESLSASPGSARLRDIDETLPSDLDERESEGDVAPARGDAVGRYLVLDRLGAGAMGVVLVAYDPQLDRRVALKLLKPRGGGGSGKAARTRLQREAQALAKLSHANVVTVHDVGVHRDRVFIAMEYVDGPTLGVWMREPGQPRPWREVVGVFTLAGRGLGAAHAAGLVHRDFKPDNVMLDQGGGVHVMDFGLARTGDDPDALASGEPDLPEALSGSTHDAFAMHLTRTGAVIGTPAYMSPEQFTGTNTDARSDQFSFCIALYEGLYGERPFAAKTVADLSLAVTSGRISEPPKGGERDVPLWLRRVVLRGLSPIAGDRFSSMEELLAALGRDPARRRRVWIQRGLIAGAVAVPVVAYAARELPVPACQNMDAPLRGVWDDARRDQVRASLLGTEVSYAQDAWLGTQSALDRYAVAWTKARASACEATNVSQQQSADLLDKRMACLDRRLRDLEATVEVLGDADADVAENAVKAAQSLPDLEACADLDGLLASVAPPAAKNVDTVRALENRLAAVRARSEAGRHVEGLELIKPITVDAEAIGYEPLLAEVYRRLARLEMHAGEFESAITNTERAYESAVVAGLPRLAAEDSAEMITLLGQYVARPAEARQWAAHARAWSRASADAGVRAKYLSNLGILSLAEGEYDIAVEQHTESLRLWERDAAARPTEVAAAYSNLGYAAYMQGRYDDSIASHTRCLEILRDTVGALHPDVGDASNNLGAALDAAGRHEEARVHYNRAKSISIDAYGENHPDVANALNNLAQLAAGVGDLEGARRDYARARDIYIQVFGPDHPDVGITLNNLGEAAALEGDFVFALEQYERAAKIFEDALGPEHPQLAYMLTGVGESLVDLGRTREAETPLRRALAIRTTGGQIDGELLAVTRFALARALVDARGRPGTESVALAREALAFRERAEGGAQEAAIIRAWLARASP